MKAVLRFLLAAALLALCAAQRPVQYKANLATVAGYMRPYPRASTPRGTAIATIYNATYATVAFDVRSVIGATMMHIHNGTVPAHPGGVALWAFESALPGVADLNPISGSFAGTVAFDPTATGVGMLLENMMAYFNVHSVAYPGGVIQGNFMRR